ncbi:MAG: hypothetical protein AB7E55_32020 [Pigmentiphaga sp.]
MTDEWVKGGWEIGRHFPPDIIARLREAVVTLRRAGVMARRIDYLLSGDDGQDSFLRRLAEELAELEKEEQR